MSDKNYIIKGKKVFFEGGNGLHELDGATYNPEENVIHFDLSKSAWEGINCGKYPPLLFRGFEKVLLPKSTVIVKKSGIEIFHEGNIKFQ